MPVLAKTEEGDPAVLPQAWQPGLTRLARSLSKENLGSLARVGDKLSSVRKSGEQLMLTAQGQVARLAEGRQRLANDLAARGPWDPAQLRPRPGMRRSSTEINFQRLHRPVGHHPASRLGPAWSLSRTLSTSKAPPGEAPEAQPDLLKVGSAPAGHRSLDSVLGAPIRAAAQETLGNCQRNMQVLKRALTEQAAELEGRLRSLAARHAGSRASLGPGPEQVSATGTGPWAGVRDDAALVLAERGPDLGLPGDQASASHRSRPSLLGALFRRGGQCSVAARDADDGIVSVLDPEDAAALAAVADGNGREMVPSAPGPTPGGNTHTTTTATSSPSPWRSSLRDPGRRITIVTTASLPWRTGTAVNPLLRAAYLARDGSRAVTLLVPWLVPAEQARVFPEGLTFATPGEQEAWVRRWVAARTGFSPRFRLGFYPARYAAEKCSILPVGDPSACVPPHEADVAVLEEPEHLTWYHHGARWSARFRHVVGVVHTNYLDYARREEHGWAKAAVLRHANAILCAAHCHRVVKLSDAVQPLPREVTRFVHGVPDTFLEIGNRIAARRAAAGGKSGRTCGNSGGAVDGRRTNSAAVSDAVAELDDDGDASTTTPAASSGMSFERGAYFIGKVVWGKGYQELLDLVAAAGPGPLGGGKLDCFGTGEDAEEVAGAAEARGLPLRFRGARDHLDSELEGYRCLVNPSTSDVVATTSAEALAMGKWLVCADLPCNAFFTEFRNCLVYRTPEEFGRVLAHAMAHDPAPLHPDEARKLSWEAATERFLDATELGPAELKPSKLTAASDGLKYAIHNALTGIEALRAAAGAGVRTRDAPPRLDDFDPSQSGQGGLFDSKRRTASTISLGVASVRSASLAPAAPAPASAAN